MPVVARQRAASTRKAEEESHSGVLWATTRTQRGAAWAVHISSDFGCSALATGRVPPEVAHPLWWCGTVRCYLSEQDRDGAPGRRDVCRCPGPADPAVASRYVPRTDRHDVDRAAEPPTLALEEELPDLALAGRCVVGDHELHSVGRQQPVA